MAKTSRERGKTMRSGHLALLFAPDLAASTTTRRFRVPSVLGLMISPSFDTTGSEK